MNKQPNRNTSYPLPPPTSQSHSGRCWARAGRLLPWTDGTGGAVRPPHYQSNQYAHSKAAAVPEPAERAAQQLFYLQPADNRVEIDRSCRQQVTPCLSAPNGSSCAYSAGQELFNSFCLSPGFTGVLQVSATLPFLPALRWCSPTVFSWVASDSEPWEDTRTSHIYIFMVHIYLLDRYRTFIIYAVPGVNIEQVWTTWSYSDTRNKLMLCLKGKCSSTRRNSEKLLSMKLDLEKGIR